MEEKSERLFSTRMKMFCFKAGLSNCSQIVPICIVSVVLNSVIVYTGVFYYLYTVEHCDFTQGC